MKNSMWKTNNEIPTTYVNVVMKFDEPFGDQLPKDEQDPEYECIEMRDPGDGNDLCWQWFEQCSTWCYLDDLIRCSKDICSIAEKFLEKNIEFEDWVGMNFEYLEK